MDGFVGGGGDVGAVRLIHRFDCIVVVDCCCCRVSGGGLGRPFGFIVEMLILVDHGWVDDRGRLLAANQQGRRRNKRKRVVVAWWW